MVGESIEPMTLTINGCEIAVNDVDDKVLIGYRRSDRKNTRSREARPVLTCAPTKKEQPKCPVGMLPIPD